MFVIIITASAGTLLCTINYMSIHTCMHIGQDIVQQVSSNFCHSIDGLSLLKLEGHLTLEGGAREKEVGRVGGGATQCTQKCARPGHKPPGTRWHGPTDGLHHCKMLSTS